LPRESDSKEIDASVLSVIGYPAFAVGNQEITERTRHEIKTKLEGPYGCKRFLLDGHQTVLEDVSRLHYEPHELKIFRGIECEWPLFFTYMILDALCRGDINEAREYRAKLESTLIEKQLPSGKTAKLVPELYYVPAEYIQEVRQNPNSKVRVPNQNVPLVWAQSLMIVGDLLLSELVSVGEIDPIGRRFRPLREKKDTLVQIVLVSEDESVQSTLSIHGLETETIEQIAPVQIHPSNSLGNLYTALGQNTKLNLSGRPNRPIGSIGTCKVYRINGEIHVFTPVFMEIQKFYLTMDNDIIVGLFKDELQFVRNNWNLPGRPTMFIMLTKNMFNSSNRKNLLNLMVSLKTGVCNHVRVRLGRMKEMINSSWLDNLDFLSHRNTFKNIFPLSKSRSNSFQHLKLEGEQAIKPRSRRNSVVGRLERKSLSLSFLDTKLKDLDAITSNEDEGDVSDDAIDDKYPKTPYLDDKIETPTTETTIEECAAQLKESNNIYVQIEILEHMVGLNGLDYTVENFASIRDLLEEIYYKSAKSQIWSVTRQAASLLRKTVDSLTAAIVDLLIRQKQIILGKGTNEYLISAPHSPGALYDLIYKYYTGDDVREASLVQEILFFLGSFIRADPKTFDGILRLRISYLINALKLEVVADEKISIEDASERLFHLSPSAVKRLLHRIFASRDDGELNSMYADFNEFKARGFPAFNPQLYKDILQGDPNVHQDFTNEQAMGKKRKVEIITRSAGFLDGNTGQIMIDNVMVFEMDRRGMGVVVIDEEDASVLETATFDTHYSAEESNQFADFITSQRSESIVAIVAKDEASESLTENAKAACELLGSLRIRELGFRGSWAMIGGKNGSVEDIRYAKEGPVYEVRKVFEIWDSSTYEFLRPSNGKWKLRRQLDGGLDRVPPEFYSAVYNVLRRARQGLTIGKSVLPRNPTVDDMTPGERNFALKIQSWLDSCPTPIERQVIVECLMILSKVAERNPEVKMNEIIHLEVISEEAIKICWNTFHGDATTYPYEQYKPIAKEFFYDLPFDGIHGSLSFIVNAIARTIPFTLKTTPECQLS